MKINKDWKEVIIVIALTLFLCFVFQAIDGVKISTIDCALLYFLLVIYRTLLEKLK